VSGFRSAGEDLAAYLSRHHLDVSARTWDPVALALVSTGRGTDWRDAFQRMAVLQLAGRLIRGGRCVLEDVSEWNSLAEQQIKQLIVDTMVVDYWEVRSIYPRLELAMLAAGRGISPTTQKALQNWSKREMPWCYLCGVSLDFDTTDPSAHDRFTLDHVWPQAFGGDSEEENLLPACAACNERKANNASWVLYPIQNLVVGTHQRELDLMPKEMRFAVLMRAAERMADDGISLKEAHLRLGKPAPPAVVDLSQAVDVFNLRPNDMESIPA
jgi:hypothetical protein